LVDEIYTNFNTNKFDVNDDFNKNIQSIFTNAITLISYKQLLPDFSNLTVEFQELIKDNYSKLDLLINTQNN